MSDSFESDYDGRVANGDYHDNGNNRNSYNNGYNKKPHSLKKRQAFEVEEYIIVKLDPDLAWALSEHIINSSPQNPAVMALGKKLEEMTS